jgi:glutamate N-acetyltransferase/amino-acid N-acetyltransferase
MDVTAPPPKPPKTIAISPLAPGAFPALAPIAGVRLGGIGVGVRYSGRLDLMVALVDPGSTIAGCYTKSLARSAPVDWCRKIQGAGKVRAIIVNSGNANAFTGKVGIASVKRTAEAAARAFSCRENEVYIASTGVIGEPLPDARITKALPGAAKVLKPAGWLDAARAIMTTDTFAKGATASLVIDGKRVTINGIAKGSGMIAPDMATMLGFVFTDAAIGRAVLQAMLARAIDRSFNAITVDSDISTSDTMLLVATGAAGNRRITAMSSAGARAFQTALDQVLRDLAQQVVRDGEGAEKFVTITVTGAASPRAARRIGLAIANSPLVKTALAGSDPNWGRIAAAVAKGGEKADRDRLRIAIGGVAICDKGQRIDGYDETPVARYMKGREIQIEVDVGIGRGKATVWTCDLTHRYIDINADYRS